MGTMGFGLPAAIGAQFAMPDRLVIDIDGDGSMRMNIGELLKTRGYTTGLFNKWHLGTPFPDKRGYDLYVYMQSRSARDDDVLGPQGRDQRESQGRPS